MKNSKNSTKTARTLDLLNSKLSGNEILNMQAMLQVRGGEGDDPSNGDIIILPPPPTKV
jgi:hypothetical protein